jgi:hypothetical protein
VLLEYFMADRRPAAWNQWAEVVGRDARQPRFIGDMPHAWISSDYIRSVLDMFAYARDSDGTLVLAAGLPASWLESPSSTDQRGPPNPRGLAVRGLRTAYGPLDLTIIPEPARWVVTVSGPTPPGGCVLQWPWAGPPAGAHVTIDGKPAQFSSPRREGALGDGAELRIPRMPARIVIDRPPATKP